MNLSRTSITEADDRRVRVTDHSVDGPVPPGRLGEIAMTVLEEEGVAIAEISVAIVGNKEIARLHTEFLDVEGPTDVLSFPLEGDCLGAWDGDLDARRGQGRRIDGEVVISAEMAAEVAPRVGSTTEAEVTLYLVHGLLHLCGYDDREPSECARMRSREAELLGKLSVDVGQRPGDLTESGD